MRSFVCLFVDDEVGQYRSVAGLAQDIEGLEILPAHSQDEALDIIATRYLHLAVVDVSLRREPTPDTDGLFLLELLRDARPSCERLLLTTLDREHRPQVLRALAPGINAVAPLADGYVDKAEPELRASEVIRDRATRWLSRPVQIEGVERVLGRLADRDLEGPHLLTPAHGAVRPNADEIDSVLSRLFGQGEPAGSGGLARLETVDTVELEPISEGWSRSVTLWCEPLTRGRAGPRCVVKVGPLADTGEEVDRYRAFVRYGLGLNHRVELLSASFGDTVGAACYTHSAARGDAQHDLQALFNQEDPLALTAVDQLFDPDSQFWIASQAAGRDLARFFQDEYGRKVHNLVQRLTAFVENEAAMTLSGSGTTVSWDGTDLAVPRREDLGHSAFSGEFTSCVVHGDLHGGNVLVTDRGQPILIDYRNMTRGPRALDFTSLEVSVRMARPAVAELELVGPGEVLARERASWAASWGSGSDGATAADPASGAETTPYWEQVSGLLRQQATRNFGDLTEVEYAATALLRTLRVFAAFAPQDDHRRRLLLYLAMLTEVLRSAG